MKKYQLAWVSLPGEDTPKFGSSDPDCVQKMVDELKIMIPSSKVRINRSSDFDLNEKMIECGFEKLNDKDCNLSVWFLQKLMLLGWEPFAVNDRDVITHRIWLRLEIIE